MEPDNKPNLNDKRDNTDQSLKAERKSSDDYVHHLNKSTGASSVPKREHFKKKLVAEALFERERKETNQNLLIERDHTERSAELQSILLHDELKSHKLTKAELSSKDEILSIVSHDLKNPLLSISLSSMVVKTALQDKGQSTDFLIQQMEKIEQYVYYMDRIISDLLEAEQISQRKLNLHPEECGINDLLLECRNLFENQNTIQPVTIKVETLDRPVYALIDSDRMLQVLSNLIGNSLKYIPLDGTIEIFAQLNEQEVIISVRDNGPGIAEYKKASVFDKFSQLRDSDRYSLGLGLYISKWIVEAHHGKIWVSDKVQDGCQINFSIPVKD